MEVKEIALWKSFKTTKDLEYRNELIQKYSKYVKIIAYKIFKTLPNTIDFADLENYGYLGLIDAIDKFDVNRNVKFETYANFRIRGAIMDGIREIDWLPRSLRDKLKQKKEDNNENVADGSTESTSCADITKIKKENNNECPNYFIVSLEESRFAQQDSCNENDDIASNNNVYSSNLDDFIVDLENKMFLSKAIAKLKKNERKIIHLYYFIGKTFKEIGNIFGLTESRVSQIHKNALISLKNIMSKY